jgi:hypothetical protein
MRLFGCEKYEKLILCIYEGWTIYRLDSSWKEFLSPVDYKYRKKNIESKRTANPAGGLQVQPEKI